MPSHLIPLRRPVTVSAVVTGLLVAAGSLLLDGGAVRPEWPLWPSPAAIAVLAASALIAGLVVVARPRAVQVLLAVTLAVGAAWSAHVAVSDVRSGTPGAATTVYCLGLVVVAVGAVAANFERPPTRARRRWLLAGAAIGLAAVSLSWIAAAGVPALPVTARTTVAVTPPDEVVAPTGQAWERMGPGHMPVAAGPGVVAADESGVIATNGATGEQAWSYSRHGARVIQVARTPNGESVVVVFRAGGPRVTDHALVVVLDAGTGATRWERIVQTTEMRDLVPTNSVLPIRTYERTGDVRADDARVNAGDYLLGIIEAYDLESGERLWTRSGEYGGTGACTSTRTRPASGADVVFVAGRCDGALTVSALDDRTGEVRWADMRPLDADPRVESRLDVSADGRWVSLRGVGPTRVLATRDGRVIHTAAAATTIRADKGDLPLIMPENYPGGEPPVGALDPRTAAITALPGKEGCAVLMDYATTADAFMRLCATRWVAGGQPEGVTVQTWALTGPDAGKANVPVGVTMPAWPSDSTAQPRLRPVPGAVVVAIDCTSGALIGLR